MRRFAIIALATLLAGCQFLEKLGGDPATPSATKPPVIERSAPAGASSAVSKTSSTLRVIPRSASV